MGYYYWTGRCSSGCKRGKIENEQADCCAEVRSNGNEVAGQEACVILSIFHSNTMVAVKREDLYKPRGIQLVYGRSRSERSKTATIWYWEKEEHEVVHKTIQETAI